jgi:dipeptidyl aminopeptidase/acylaminoacyl peptidase
VSHDSPPFLIQHGDADKTMPLEQARVMAEALQKAGVEETLMVMPGAGHAGAAFFTDENHKTVLAYLDKHLKSTK